MRGEGRRNNPPCPGRTVDVVSSKKKISTSKAEGRKKG